MRTFLLAAVAASLAMPVQAQQPGPGQNPNANNHEYTVQKYAIGDKKSLLQFIASVKADCAPSDWLHVEVIKDAEHGVTNLADVSALPNYTAPNPRVRCNDKQVRGKMLEYTPIRGYQGGDSIEVEAIDNAGAPNVYKYEITVK